MTMIRAIRLHGPKDLRLDHIPAPPPPGPGEVLLQVGAVGICGSDLHSYLDGRIGDTVIAAPLVLGHEFAGTVQAVGPDTFDGNHQPLLPGTTVAVDPAIACGHCELCLRGDPNLCTNLRFAGLFPHPGALCEQMIVPAATCFPLPPGTDPAIGALLETLGVALHAVDLAKIQVGNTIAILGAGPIGLSILQVARLTGASQIFVSDKFPWRLELTQRYGAIPIHCDSVDPVGAIAQATRGRGVDVAIEAAWADHSIEQAADMARNGGRLVLVGIPSDDRLTLRHSVARRKGLTIRMVRRMKHAYPRAIDLYQRHAVDLPAMISHRVPLAEAPQAFALNADYRENVLKVIIDL